MKCPVDGTELLMTERQGVEIDYCPQCRGVWLDRGELDKIIEKATPAVVLPDPDPISAPPPMPDPVVMDAPQDMRMRQHASQEGVYDRKRTGRDRYRDEGGDYSQARRYKKKRKSILAEIFDFDFD